MKAGLKNFFSLILRFGLSIGLLVFLYKKIDVQSTMDVVRQADVPFLLLALVSFLLIYVVLLVRWFKFIRALNLQVSAWQVVRFFFVGLFGNLFLPTAIGGDIIKTAGLCYNHADKPKVVASVLLDRLSGYAGIALTALVVFPFASQVIQDGTMKGMVLAMLGGILVLGAVLFHEKIYSFFCRAFARFPRFKEALMKIHYDAALLKGRRDVLCQTVLLSCLAQVLLAMTFWLVGLALHQTVAFIYYLMFIPMICVASAMPSIGGLGVREAGAAYLFGKVGMAPGVAVSISLVNFVYMTAVGAAGGLFFLLSRPSKKEKHSVDS